MTLVALPSGNWRKYASMVHQRARSSRAPYQRFPLERSPSQMRMASSVARKSEKATAKALGWSLASGGGSLTGFLTDQIPAQSWFGEGCSIYPPCPVGVPFSSILNTLQFVSKRTVFSLIKMPESPGWMTYSGSDTDREKSPEVYMCFLHGSTCARCVGEAPGCR